MSTETDRLDVENVIRDAIGWALTKDINRLFSIMAQDDDFFIFHPDSKSTIVGFEAFKKLGERVWMRDEFKATDFAVRDLHVTHAPSLAARSPRTTSLRHSTPKNSRPTSTKLPNRARKRSS